MPELLSLSRAARLVGTSRGALQKKIQNGELTTFEGKVAVTDLLRAYPQTQMEDSKMLERVERIKAQAVHDRGKRDKTALPDPEVLATRITSLSKDLLLRQAELKKYKVLIQTVREKLAVANQIHEQNLATEIQQLNDWLTTELQTYADQEIEASTQLLAKDAVLRIMAAHVKLIPSGHDFFVEGSESILQAALHTGLAMNYGCTNGHCGSCKARIVSGEVHQIAHHDYVISEAEKQMGYRLLCSHTAVTDLVIEVAEAHGVKDIPCQQIETKVKKLTKSEDDLFILHLQTPRTQTLRFFAGQMVTLHLANQSATCYLASCPCDGRNLEFHLSREQGADFYHAISQLTKGERLEITGPSGEFVLQEDSNKPALFLAYAHGFAPIKSLIEHAMALDTVAAFHLYWIAPNEMLHYQNNQCRAWTDALDNFSYTPLIADQMETTQLTQALAQVKKGVGADLNQFEVYIAGSESFLATAKAFFQSEVPESQLHLGGYLKIE
jgi:CDP-4-dehydro-6-deoxyglucose reductase